jgi:hypothetical protein
MWNEVWDGWRALAKLGTSQVQLSGQGKDAGLMVKMGDQGYFEAAGG